MNRCLQKLKMYNVYKFKSYTDAPKLLSKVQGYFASTSR